MDGRLRGTGFSLFALFESTIKPDRLKPVSYPLATHLPRASWPPNPETQQDDPTRPSRVGSLSVPRALDHVTLGVPGGLVQPQGARWIHDPVVLAVANHMGASIFSALPSPRL